jgi:hypothetical protein
MRRLLLLTLMFIVGLCSVVSSQTFYNPTTLQFEHDDYAITDHYIAEFWVAGTPLTTQVASVSVPKSSVTLFSAGPPATYRLLFKDIPVFLPFGKNYVVRLLACDTAQCSAPSEVTREQVRYTYCKSTDFAVRPLTIVQGTQANGTPNGYVPVVLTINSVRPVTAVSISLVGAGVPAYYFTGIDMRGTITLSLGPLPRAGRYLMNLSAADEAACSTSQASQYLTVR